MDNILGAELAAKLIAHKITFGELELRRTMRPDTLQLQPLLSATIKGTHNNTKLQPAERMPSLNAVMKALQKMFQKVTDRKMAPPCAYIAAYALQKHYIPPVVLYITKI